MPLVLPRGIIKELLAAKTVFLFLFSVCFFQVSYTEDSFTSFDENWTISLFVNNNNGFFHQTASSNYSTNRPLSLGLGISYKWFSLGASFSVPFAGTESSFDLDFEFNTFFDRMYFSGYFRLYNHYFEEDTNEPIEFGTLSAGIMAVYIRNYENHSLESTIKMSKKQNISSRSMLYCFGAFGSSYLVPPEISEANNDFTDIQRLYYFGPGIGYSIIRVFESGLFFNPLFVIYSNIGFSQNADKWLFIPLINANFIIGYHFNTWSFNLKLMNNVTILLEDFSGNSNTALMGAINIGLTVSKRF